MNKVIVCVLLVEDAGDKEAIQQLLHTSIPSGQSTIVEAASVQEMWTAMAAAEGALQSRRRGEGQLFRVGKLTIDHTRRLVKLGTEEMHLTPTEYHLLTLLAAQAGGVLSHEQLMQEIWSTQDAHTLHLLRVNISNLRRKLNNGSTGSPTIMTIPGIGYRLRGEL